MIKLKKYDFIDFGSGIGGCIDFSKKSLGGKEGLGLDKSKKKIDILTNEGYNCLQLDVLNIDPPEKIVKFVTMSHFLEHLPTIEDVEDSINIAKKLATDFIFIEGPTFDFDNYLNKLGYKFFWSDWLGHNTHLTTIELRKIFSKLKLNNYTLLKEHPYITGTDSRDIHPLNSPVDQLYYNEECHPKKKFFKFEKPLFRSFIYFVWLKKDIDKRKFINCRRKFKLSAHYTY